MNRIMSREVGSGSAGKKILKGLGLGITTLGLIVAGAAMFSAFEAHVVNVTARIENALSVNTTPIEFGTAFPQEYLTRDVSVSLSQSFLDEGRVDDVEYTIKQKPKVKDAVASCDPNVTLCDPNANPVPGDPEAIITPTSFPNGIVAWQYCEDNLPLNAPYSLTPADLTAEYWKFCYLPLADDLSKHSSVTTDHSVDAFHHAYQWTDGKSALVTDNIASGRLTKAGLVTLANWTIDLKVPCFVSECAQEASNPDNTVNDNVPGFYVPREYRLPSGLEHKVFGTDLWIEVTNISTAHGGDQPLATCGNFLSQVADSGFINNNSAYDYTMPDPTPSTTGNLADHRWIHLTSAGVEGVWDMGAAVGKAWVVPSIDHGPVPDESNETLVYSGDSPSGPWTLATLIGASSNGPTNWISDDDSRLWQFIGNHRYVRLVSGATDTVAAAAQGIFASDDAEIDAVCNVGFLTTN